MADGKHGDVDCSNDGQNIGESIDSMMAMLSLFKTMAVAMAIIRARAMAMAMAIIIAMPVATAIIIAIASRTALTIAEATITLSALVTTVRATVVTYATHWWSWKTDLEQPEGKGPEVQGRNALPCCPGLYEFLQCDHSSPKHSTLSRPPSGPEVRT